MEERTNEDVVEIVDLDGNESDEGLSVGTVIIAAAATGLVIIGAKTAIGYGIKGYKWLKGKLSKKEDLAEEVVDDVVDDVE